MPVLPAEIPARLVTAQFYFVSADNADADTDPQLEKVTGFVRFTSTAPVLRVPTKKSVLIPLEFDAKFNAQGQLVTLEDPSIGLKLPRTDSDLINPVDYTWRADFYLNKASNNHTIKIPSFEFKVPAPPAGKPNEPLDLADVMPVQASSGVQIIQGPAPSPADVDKALVRADLRGIVREAVDLTGQGIQLTPDASNPGLYNGPNGKFVSVNANFEFPEPVKRRQEHVVASTARKGMPVTFRPARTLVAFSFDDGPTQDKTLALPILDAKGIKGSFGVIADTVGTSGKLTWDDLYDMEAQGHEIMSHSATHVTLNAAAGAAVLEREINGAYQTLIGKGLNVTGFIWPNGSSDSTARAIVRQNHQYAIGGGQDGRGTTQPLHSYSIGRHTIHSASSTASVRARIDQAVANKEFLIFIIHAGIDFGTNVQNVMRDAIDYTQSLSIPIVTVREGIDMVGNVYDAGDIANANGSHMVVTGDGQMRASGMPVITPTNAITAATLPNFFQAGVITYSAVSAPGNTDWPVTGQSVNIITNRTDGSGYGFAIQIMFANNGDIYFRRATGGTTWGAWSTQAAIDRIDNTVTAATPPVTNGFPSGKITYTTVTSAENTDWPVTGVVANITTDRSRAGAAQYILQEFRTGDQIFMRRPTSNSAWGPWKSLTLS